MKAEFKLGYLNLSEYKTGDTLEWFGGRNSRRPENGDCTGEGYAVCPKCNRDFWLIITVRHDVIASVDIDPVKKGYIVD